MIKKLAKLIFLLAAPIVLVCLGLAFVIADLITRARKRLHHAKPALPAASDAFHQPANASVVIPNWNGRDLLERFLPAVVEACRPDDEIIVVDNASRDGSAEFVRRNFPRVRVLEMERNLGFGGGSNAGVRAARNRVAILLNNDMRILPGFVPALLAGFTDPNVFAVSAQIFFSDPARRREETGLTSGRFTKGFFRVRHDIDERVETLYPALYAGGGSSAYDREKFLELGGFDPLFEPFYLEDTDLSYNAWKRGWKVLYQPQARVFHEHRGTIGKHFPPEAIQAFLEKNYVLMVWKNLHHAGGLCSHLLHLYGHMLLRFLGQHTPTRTAIGSFLLALRQMPQALRARRAALLRSTIGDQEVFERLRPSIFHDTFRNACVAFEDDGFGAFRDDAFDVFREDAARPRGGISSPSTLHNGEPAPSARSRLNVLFVSPYAIYPPLHGGAVLMLQALRQMSAHYNLYVLTFVDSAAEAAEQRNLERWVKRVETLVRKHRPGHPFRLRSHAEQTFGDPEFAAQLDQMVYLHDIDLIQFEYTQLAQYRLALRGVPQCLFEHDIYFRSVGRQLTAGRGSWLAKSQELLEWLRGLRYEVNAVERFDAVLTCHDEEERVLKSFVRNGRPRIIPGLRTAVEAARYPFPGGPRQPDSLLFVGNFQHRPNAEGLQYFIAKVLPLIRAKRPSAILYVVGAGAATRADEQQGPGVRLLGQVPDIQEPLGRYAVFVCPILTGAGVRVKILEAFASGIPVVSTALGAEGLAVVNGKELMLADRPADFAAACLALLEDSGRARTMALQARRLVETRYDWPVAMEKLDRVYRALVAERRKLLPACREAERSSAPAELIVPPQSRP